jgi:hypothetical protein
MVLSVRDASVSGGLIVLKRKLAVWSRPKSIIVNKPQALMRARITHSGGTLEKKKAGTMLFWTAAWAE